MILRKQKRNRGFGLAEAVLALAIISIATVGTLTLITSGQKATQVALDKQQAQFYAADIITCYRTDNFEESLQFAFGAGCDESNQLTLPDNMLAKLSFEGKKLTVTVFKGDKQLAELSFTKGGTP